MGVCSALCTGHRGCSWLPVFCKLGCRSGRDATKKGVNACRRIAEKLENQRHGLPLNLRDKVMEGWHSGNESPRSTLQPSSCSFLREQVHPQRHLAHLGVKGRSPLHRGTDRKGTLNTRNPAKRKSLYQQLLISHCTRVWQMCRGAWGFLF